MLFSHKTFRKTSSIWLTALVVLIALSSCQKVIDVKLDDADKKLVIDAVLTDHEGGCIVKISKTKSFNESNNFTGLGGATVSIKDESGNITALTETATGVFTHPSLKGIYGKTYQLLVQAEGKNYTSSSTMPQLVTFDSAYLETQKFFD